MVSRAKNDLLCLIDRVPPAALEQIGRVDHRTTRTRTSQHPTAVLYLHATFCALCSLRIAIFHTSATKQKQANPFDQYMSRFLTINLIVNLAILAIIIKMAFSDLETLRRLNNYVVVILFIVSLFMTALFLVYGFLMFRQLTKGGYVSGYAKKMVAVALGLSTCFSLSNAILMFSIADVNSFQDNSYLYNDLYFTVRKRDIAELS
jgi:hypothetical protein